MLDGGVFCCCLVCESSGSGAHKLYSVAGLLFSKHFVRKTHVRIPPPSTTINTKSRILSFTVTYICYVNSICELCTTTQNTHTHIHEHCPCKRCKRAPIFGRVNVNGVAYRPRSTHGRRHRCRRCRRRRRRRRRELRVPTPARWHPLQRIDIPASVGVVGIVLVCEVLARMCVYRYASQRVNLFVFIWIRSMKWEHLHGNATL